MRSRIQQRLRVLDFDIETRRIGFHTAGRFAPDGCEPVAIAASWMGSDDVRCWAQPDVSSESMLLGFKKLYDEADIVTGHYIRKFDLPILNGAMLEHGLPLLGPKLTSDTMLDLVRFAGMSKSQENMSLTLGVDEGKFHMSDFKWRRVARLDPAMMRDCYERATSDIKQNKAYRQRLIDAKALKPPKVWRP